MADTLCVPLMAQASAIGVLCMRRQEPVTAGAEAALPQALAEAVSEQISLSLANLMLREELPDLSMPTRARNAQPALPGTDADPRD